MNSIRRRLGFPSPALIVAFLALSVSLGAAAYAAVKAPKNSVVSSSVKNEALKGGDIKDNSLTGDDVDEGSLKINLPDASSSATPSGAAGGDLTGSYPNPTLADGIVVAAKVAEGAISAGKLADGSVETAKIADGAVSTAKVADSAVTSGKLANDAATSAKIPADAIGVSELAGNAVFGSNISNGTITTDDIAGNTITGDDVNLGYDEEVDFSANNSDTFRTGSADCTGGRTAVGGGAYIVESNANQQPLIALIDSNVSDSNTYIANATEINGGTAGDWQLQVKVICLDL